MKRRHVRVTVLIVVSCVLGGCTGDLPEDVVAPEARVEVPRSNRALLAANDILAEITASAQLDRDTPSSLQLAAGLDSRVVSDTIEAMAELGPWEQVESDTGESADSAELVLRSHGGRHMTLHVNVDRRGDILGLWFGHAVDRSVHSKDALSVEAEIAAVPGASNVSLWRIDGDRCSLMAKSGNRAGNLPLASVSKLFVAAAALRAIQKGEAGWADQLTITEANRSLPSGALAGAPVGTSVSLREAVVAAVLESDNTANDLIVEHLGVSFVMDTAREITGTESAGHFWTTREVFEIGWGENRGDPPEFDPKAPERTDAFRKLYARDALTVEPLAVHSSRWQDGVDWYASSQQLCVLAGWLDGNRDELPKQLTEGSAAGLAADVPAGTWLWKPGGAPGVSASLGVFEREGERYIVTGQFASTHVPDVADSRGLQLLTSRFASTGLEALGSEASKG